MDTPVNKQTNVMLRRFGIALLALVVLIPPSGFLWLSMRYETQDLEKHAAALAAEIARIAYLRPDTWHFEGSRMEYLLEVRRRPEVEFRQIIGPRGTVIVGDGVLPGPPLLRGQAPIKGTGRIVGSVRFAKSMTPLVWQTFAVLLISLTIGMLLYWLLNLLAFRSLIDTVGHLHAAQRDLITDLAARETALAEATERAEQLERLVSQDALTGLLNREAFIGRLETILDEAEDAGIEVAVVLLDLDRFREVNNRYGQGCGDEVLRRVATRLSESEFVTSEHALGRLGGDSFAVVLRDSGKDNATRFGWRIMSLLDAPFQIEGHRLQIGANCGVAVFPWDAEATADLLKHAEVSLYDSAWRMGTRRGNGEDSAAYSAERLALTSALRGALQDSQILVHYQPVCSVATGRTVSIEALARWQRPQKGNVAPGMFIPLAEQIGLIVPLTYWVLEQAVVQVTTLRDAGYLARVSVNLSSQVFLEQRLYECIDAMLTKHGCDPDALCLEVTDDPGIETRAEMRRQLGTLKELGVRFAVDDFGSHRSSFETLSELPIDELKIDRSFVFGCRGNPRALSLVQSMVHVAHDLGLEATAKGVEDDLLWERIGATHCDLVQGYHIARPMPGPELLRWFDEHEPRQVSPHSS